MNGFVTSVLPDPRWFRPTVTRVVPSADGDPFGILAPLRGTGWEGLLPAIDPGTLERALLGDAGPFMRAIGVPPAILARRVPETDRPCLHRASCVLASEKCVPGTETPDCWESESFPEISAELAFVVLQWKAEIPVFRLTDP